MSVQKVPDLSSWKKVGRMNTALGTSYDLYESPDQLMVAQVDDDLIIYLILKNGELHYMNPKTVDGLKRMKEVKEALKKQIRKTEC
ncbi:MAG: hypothetical protein NWE89_10000 [Candidatus Bathyarchaeota archaeon]|nr:hypothetical protein [Candidatus Bathyarchaeota archaeon]